MQLKPYLLSFPAYGFEEIGMLSVVENGLNKLLPFDIQRVVWTYNVPSGVNRGHLAHLNTGEVLIAVKGKMQINTESLDGTIMHFELTKPTEGLFIPARTWHYVNYIEETFQLSLASLPYDERDYVRDYEGFKKLAFL